MPSRPLRLGSQHFTVEPSSQPTPFSLKSLPVRMAQNNTVFVLLNGARSQLEGEEKKPFHRVGEKISPNRELSHLYIGSFSHKWFLVPRHHAVPSLAPEQSEIPGGRGWGAAPCFLEMWSLVRLDRGSGCKWQGLVIACGTGANRPGRQMLRGVSTQQKPARRRLGVAGRVGKKNRKRKYSMPV